jgi:hypothetical protein
MQRYLNRTTPIARPVEDGFNAAWEAWVKDPIISEALRNLGDYGLTGTNNMAFHFFKAGYEKGIAKQGEAQ